MQVEWYGQSSFRLSEGEQTVFIDPFDDMTAIIIKAVGPAVSGDDLGR